MSVRVLQRVGVHMSVCLYARNHHLRSLSVRVGVYMSEWLCACIWITAIQSHATHVHALECACVGLWRCMCVYECVQQNNSKRAKRPAFHVWLRQCVSSCGHARELASAFVRVRVPDGYTT